MHEKSLAFGYSAEHDATDYWKLDKLSYDNRRVLRDRMQRSGFYTLSSSNRERLLSLHHRMERGLISYEKCSIPELRKFLKDRCLSNHPSGSSTRKRDFVATLEEADDAATFDKFEDLPPELRARVYKLYFEGLEMPLCPLRPPISQVSRSVREEVLPLFYSCCTFKLQIDVGADEEVDPQGNWRLPGEIEVEFNPATSKFFAETKPGHLRRIQNLHVLLERPSDWSSDGFGWKATVGGSQQRRTMFRMDATTADRFRYERDKVKAWLTSTHESLKEVIDVINARPEAHRLRRSDTSLIRFALESADEDGLKMWATGE